MDKIPNKSMINVDTSNSGTKVVFKKFSVVFKLSNVNLLIDEKVASHIKDITLSQFQKKGKEDANN